MSCCEHVCVHWLRVCALLCLQPCGVDSCSSLLEDAHQALLCGHGRWNETIGNGIIGGGDSHCRDCSDGVDSGSLSLEDEHQNQMFLWTKIIDVDGIICDGSDAVVMKVS